MVSEHAPERSRLACTALLGVDVYVSRRPLPQALPSRITPAPVDAARAEGAHARSSPITPGTDDAPQRRPLRSAAAVLADTAVASVAPSLGTAPAGRAASAAGLAAEAAHAAEASPLIPAASRVAPPVAGGPAAVTRSLSRSVAFNLVTVTFPSGVMFVSDIRQVPLAPAVESGVLSFLRDVMLAIGRPDPSVAAGAEYFQWPLVKKPGVDASEGTARDVLAGLISRKLREAEADTIVLMGRAANTFVRAQSGDHGSGQFAHHGVRILQCEPLGKLFATPSKKAELWHILQPLISRS